MIDMKDRKFTAKTLAIVKFGPATDIDGMRPAEYYQVTIDPSQISPTGDFIRFGRNAGDEINGWQRCEAMTVVEVLGDWEEGLPPHEQTFMNGTQGEVILRTIEIPE